MKHYTLEQIDQARAATMRHLADIQQRREAVMQAYGQAMSEIDRDFIRLSAELVAYAEMERNASKTRCKPQGGAITTKDGSGAV